jgi:hypothetical protein
MDENSPLNEGLGEGVAYRYHKRDSATRFVLIPVIFMWKTSFPGDNLLQPVLRIRVYKIHMFLGLPDPDSDPLVRDTDPDLDPDPDPSIIKQKK